MYACDFEYDGKKLSDFGFVVCDITESSGFETVSAGSQIVFNKVSMHSGQTWGLAGTKYQDCIQTTFHICKDTSDGTSQMISYEEFRSIMRWLNRRRFLRFRFTSPDESSTRCYYNASFNVSRNVINKDTYALELVMETDAPFGYGETVTESWTSASANASHIIQNKSDEIGYIYPDLKITCQSAGDLSISSDIGACTMVVKNCSVGEVITIDNARHIISSSLAAHKLHKDFNFEFFRLGSTYNTIANTITTSIPCSVEISYDPIIKDSPEGIDIWQ